MTRVNSCLGYVEAIVEVHDQSLAALDSLVTDFENFIEVLILTLVSIDLQDILHTI